VPRRILVTKLLFCLLAAELVSAPFRVASAAPTPGPSSIPEQIHVGDSIVALNGPWKFRVGDSPIDPATHQPLWAQPSFDDSTWETVDLTAPSGSFDPIAGTSGYLPGWTAKGHPGYWGWAWYRIRVKVDAKPGMKLALAGPSDVDDIYQAFDNGDLVGAFGDFSGSSPQIYTTRPEMFPLPATGPSAGSTIVLAFRVFMEPYTLTQLDDVGGFHNPPLLGEASIVAAQQQVKWDELYRSYAGTLIEALVFLLLGILALSLTFFDRSDHVYLWIGALLLTTSASSFISILSTWTEWIPYAITGPFRLVFLTPLILVGWVIVWRVWFKLRRPAWAPYGLAVLYVLLVISNSLGQNLFFTVVPASIGHPAQMISLAVRLVLAALLLATVFQGIREQGLEGWAAIPPVLLAGIAEFANELNFSHILNFWFPFGVQLTVRQLANLLLVAALALLLMRRLIISLRRQRQMALDVKQAQEVQQVILPQPRTVLPGLEIESEYRPALEVGGDFFQIIPNPIDGSLLIVAGDVTGKGLKAGMLVALLVGAIRTVAQFKPDPLVLLDALNQRLLGRGESYATCLAMVILLDGRVTLANAGHIAPYLNGQSMDLEGSLPLGMLETPEFSLMRFQLKEGDRLMLLSDGIAEATDANGQLFGFERVQELLRTATGAAQIATAAQKFGQEDDISVISVTRTAVLEPSPA
jgi:serine phosphatase RsbU (regulator of sigma subunit)